MSWHDQERKKSPSSINELFIYNYIHNFYREKLLFPRDGWTDVSLVEKLSHAMRIFTTLGKDRGLIHTTEVARLSQKYIIC